MDEIANYSESVFEDIKHVNEYSQEFWCARELQIALEYKQWRRFQNVIEKAKESCINSGNSVEDHFADVGKIVEAGAASKDIGDIQLSRYAGVESNLDYAIFQNYGYQGLYGGLGAKEIHARKELKKSQKILDHMGSTELAANLFRATQTEEKLRRENIQGKQAANNTHYEVGKKVRQTIAELGGTMPEDLPTPEKSIKQIEKEQKKLEQS